MIRTARLSVVAAATVLAGVSLGACGGSSLSASSSCRDFMNANATEQHEMIDQLASEYQKPDYTSPLGEPEVPYDCSANATNSLGYFFQHAEGSPRPALKPRSQFVGVHLAPSQ